MMKINRRYFLGSAGALVAGYGVIGHAIGQASAETGHLRIAMTASDIPTTTGMPTNGAEGMRFLGYPVFEPLVDWDYANAVERRAKVRAALAQEWSVDESDKRFWTFKLRDGVRFHDGSVVDADAIVWNLARIYDEKAPHFDPAASAIARARVPNIVGWNKVDDKTVRIETNVPLSYFLSLAVQLPIVSKARFEEVGSDWNAFGANPSGTGPFRITKVTPRVSVELEPNKEFWDKERVPKLNKVTLFPMPEATTRLAALRSGQVDWIEVPPPDTIPSLKDAGFEVVTKIYPHIWPWIFDTTEGPLGDVRVRQALNYAIDRAGLVELLNGTAVPATGFVASNDPSYGKPSQNYGRDLKKAKALLKEAGYDESNPVRFKVMISTGGSGQMMPIPMNEFLQQNLAEAGVQVDFEVVEWGALLVAFRKPPQDPARRGCQAINISLIWSDPSMWHRFFHTESFTPNGSNWGFWKSEEYDAIFNEVRQTFDDDRSTELLAKAHEILVEQSPWLWVVHDLNPRAMSPKVKGFQPIQSWFLDLSPVTVE